MKEGVYSAYPPVFADDGWGGFARALEETVPGCSVSLVVPLDADLSVLEAVDLDRRGVPDVIEWHSPSCPAEFYQPFIERFRFEAENPFLVPRIAVPGTGLVRRTDELISLADLERSAMFNEWMKPQELTIGPNLVAYLREGVRDIPAVHLFRRRRRRPFSESEAAALRVLVPHMKQALRTKARLAASENARQALAEVLDRLTLGVILVDAKGRVASANRAARKVLEAGGGLAHSRGELRANTPSKTSELQRLLAAATAAGSGVGTNVGGALRLCRGEGRDLVVLVTPLRAGEHGRDGTPAAAVFLTDCEFDRGAAIEVLRVVYDLTPREAELAVELAAGRSLAAAADALGTTLSTERSRLADVFEKTATERQAELVRLVLREAAQLCGGE